MPWPSSGPTGIAIDKNQNVWTSNWNRSQIAEYAPATQAWSQYATITSNAQPSDMTIGPDGNPWFAEKSGNNVGLINESAGNKLSEYSVPSAFSIDSNPDGNLYASSLNGDLERITTSGAVTPIPIPDIPFEISSDSAGNIWYTTDTKDSGKIVERQPSGTLTDYYPSSPHNASYGLTEGPPNTGMWFTELYAGKIGNVTPSGSVVEYTVPTANSQPTGIIAACGNLWFTERATNKIGRITPGGVFTEYNVPTPNAGPDRVAIDANGNVWFSEFNVGKIAMIVTNGSPITEYPLPGPSAGPAGITVDAHGNVWVADWSNSRIDELPSGSQTWAFYPTPTKNSEPSDMTLGPDGNPWFTEFAGNHDGVVNEAMGNAISEYYTTSPFGIDTNPNGYMYVSSLAGAIERLSTNGSILGFGVQGTPFEVSHDALPGDIWYTTDTQSSHVVLRNPNGTFVTYSTLTPGGAPYGITPGPTGTGMWFTELNGNKIGNITSTGKVVEYAIPTASSQPNGIVSACGRLWFTERATDKIGELTTSGTFTEYPVPTANAGPDRMTVDAAGNVWFSEFNAGNVGEISAAQTCQ